jgi:hypothetical protein
MVRPLKYTDEVIDEIVIAMDAYIDQTPIPITAEFAWQNKIPKSTLYNLAEKHEGLLDSIKRLTDKKEAQLERLGLTGKVDKTMAIFSLKQLGWRDKNETEHTGTVGVSIIDDIKKPCKKE